MMFTDHPVIAEQCRHSAGHSCPYIEKDILLTEADQVMMMHDKGVISANEADNSIVMLEAAMEEAQSASCHVLNTEDCPVTIEMSEGDRLMCAYNCTRSANCDCPHLEVKE